MHPALSRTAVCLLGALMAATIAASAATADPNADAAWCLGAVGEAHARLTCDGIAAQLREAEAPVDARPGVDTDRQRLLRNALPALKAGLQSCQDTRQKLETHITQLSSSPAAALTQVVAQGKADMTDLWAKQSACMTQCRGQDLNTCLPSCQQSKGIAGARTRLMRCTPELQ
jgi:hypothetical protein